MTQQGFGFRLASPKNGLHVLLIVILSSVTQASVLDLFTATDAYLQGHFRLTSGLHSGEYLQCAKVLAYPQYAAQFGQALASALRPHLTSPLALIVSPAIGGVVIGHEVARALGTRSFFTERDGATREMTLRRGFAIEQGETAVVIEDVMTTGGSTREVIRLLQSLNATVIAAASIIDRSGGTAEVGVPRLSLATLHPLTYQPEACPLCNQSVPLVKPGSRPV